MLSPYALAPPPTPFVMLSGSPLAAININSQQPTAQMQPTARAPGRSFGGAKDKLTATADDKTLIAAACTQQIAGQLGVVPADDFRYQSGVAAALLRQRGVRLINGTAVYTAAADLLQLERDQHAAVLRAERVRAEQERSRLQAALDQAQLAVQQLQDAAATQQRLYAKQLQTTVEHHAQQLSALAQKHAQQAAGVAAGVGAALARMPSMTPIEPAPTPTPENIVELVEQRATAMEEDLERARETAQLRREQRASDATKMETEHEKELKALRLIREKFRKRSKRAKATATSLRQMYKVTSKDDEMMRRLIKQKGVPEEQRHLRALWECQLRCLFNKSHRCRWHPAILAWCVLRARLATCARDCAPLAVGPN
jgi:hypothetical protein